MIIQIDKSQSVAWENSLRNENINYVKLESKPGKYYVKEFLPDHLLASVRVDEITKPEKDYVLASRQFKAEDSVFQLMGKTIGGNDVHVIAGPCSVENYDSFMRTVEPLAELGIKFLRGGAFKPRTSPYAFQGLQEEGLKNLQEAKKQFGMAIVTELMSTDKYEEVSEVADIIQVGSRNMFNYPLLKALGASNKPVLLKRGMSAQMNELLLSAEYILAHGNEKVMLCERGIKTFEKATRNTFDINAIPYLRQASHLPVVADPSHACGLRELVPDLSMAAVACGAQLLEIEVHHNPEQAWSDGRQSISPSSLKTLLERIDQYQQIKMTSYV